MSFEFVKVSEDIKRFVFSGEKSIDAHGLFKAMG